MAEIESAHWDKTLVYTSKFIQSLSHERVETSSYVGLLVFGNLGLLLSWEKLNKLKKYGEFLLLKIMLVTTVL